MKQGHSESSAGEVAMEKETAFFVLLFFGSFCCDFSFQKETFYLKIFVFFVSSQKSGQLYESAENLGYTFPPKPIEKYHPNKIWVFRSPKAPNSKPTLNLFSPG